jgi:predicted phosphodiesterase
VRRHFLLLVALLIAPASQAGGFSFGLFGDTPYTHWERQHLPELMAEMDREDLTFVIHDGDIKSGSDECSDKAFDDILGIFANSAHPLIYVPGDNEWTDCHRRSNGGYQPLERLAKLRQLFFANELTLGKRRFALERQSAQAEFSAYRENARWQAGEVLFVTLNIPGSNNNHDAPDRTDFITRSRANSIWLEKSFALARTMKLPGILIVIQGNPGFQAANAGHPPSGYRQFLEQLIAETRNFPGQVVLVHGDTHRQRIDQPLEDPETGMTLRNFTRVETHGSPSFGWTKGTVDQRNPRLFHFEPRVVAGPKLQ